MSQVSKSNSVLSNNSLQFHFSLWVKLWMNLLRYTIFSQAAQSVIDSLPVEQQQHELFLNQIGRTKHILRCHWSVLYNWNVFPNPSTKMTNWENGTPEMDVWWPQGRPIALLELLGPQKECTVDECTVVVKEWCFFYLIKIIYGWVQTPTCRSIKPDIHLVCHQVTCTINKN